MSLDFLLHRSIAGDNFTALLRRDVSEVSTLRVKQEAQLPQRARV